VEDLFYIVLVKEEFITTPEYYAITKNGEWEGHGNFCGWYSNEFYKNVSIYGILDKDYNIIELYDKPQEKEKLCIYSIMWGGNRRAKTIEDIKLKNFV